MSPLNTIILFLLLTTLLPGCHSQSPPVISGRISMTSDLKPRIYLIQPRHFREIAADYQGQVLDSADIDADGNFSFTDSTLPDKQAVLLLAMQQKSSRFANHLLDENPASSNYMPIIFTPGESIVVEADGKAFHRTMNFINPSASNRQLMHLRNMRIEGFEKYAQATSDLQDDSLIIEREKAYIDFIAPMMQFADTTSVDEAALLALRWISPTNDFERIPEFITRQCDRLQRYSNPHPFAADICAIADPQHLALRVGDTLPDFPLPMSNGDTVGLHSILGNKLTILDLWASWCAPCRIENRKVLSPLYQQYRDAGLQIIGYALDAESAAWNAAISKDNAIWLHASHLTGDSSPFLDALRITTIPANYILDGKGKILAKNLHGVELEGWLKSFFK